MPAAGQVLLPAISNVSRADGRNAVPVYPRLLLVQLFRASICSSQTQKEANARVSKFPLQRAGGQNLIHSRIGTCRPDRRKSTGDLRRCH